MAIDLSKLSAKELYELAMRKEQEEQQAAQRQQQLIELQKRRALLMSAHQVALAEIERKISELTSQRGKLIAEHEKSMGNIGKEISELTQKLQESERAEMAARTAGPAEVAKAPPAPPKPPEVPAKPAAAAPAPTPAVAPVQITPAAVEEEQSSAHEEMAETAGAIAIDSKDELFEKIRELMRTRSFISHGLLKEQLKVKGYTVPNLSKLVDQLIRDGKLASAGGGNYALGKKA